MNGDDFISQRGLARKLGISVSSVRNWRKSGRLPEPDMALGRTRRWRWGAVLAFLGLSGETVEDDGDGLAVEVGERVEEVECDNEGKPLA
jgi:predicted DNA-binding transcriptional regulator AlpA